MILDPLIKRVFGRKPSHHHADYSPLIWGVVGTVLITIFFYLIQALGMGSWSAPLWFMRDNWYLVSPLIIGFGVQVGLFRAIRQKARQGSATLIASGGVSATSMVACCMHHVADLLPIIGFTGVATFFSTYQTQVFLVSILFVVAGTLYMWKKYRDVHAHCEMEKARALS